jgi:hypothetical protein
MARDTSLILTLPWVSGEGFDYTDQKHDISNMRGLAAADSFFWIPAGAI